jgi:hypothetical protein
VLYDLHQLGALAEASADQFIERLAQGYPRTTTAPSPVRGALDPTAILKLIELLDRSWQEAEFKLWGSGRGTNLALIHSAGRQLVLGPMVDRLVIAGADGRVQCTSFYMEREEANWLVAEIKRFLGLAAASTPTAPIPPPGITTTAAKQAEEKAGRLIAELVERGERPENKQTLFEQLRKEVVPIGHLTGAAAERQWVKHAPPEWKEAGSRKKS